GDRYDRSHHHPQRITSRRSRLGHRAARHALLGGIRLGGQFRGVGRGDRSGVRDETRPRARAMLDRRTGRRAGRLCFPRAGIGHDREAAPAAGGAGRARGRRRGSTRGRVHPLRPRRQLSHADPLDERCTPRRQAPLRARGLPPRPERSAPQLRPRSRRRNLGTDPL
ncbi:MAG: Histone acetyltransferase HPA2 and related acetyltransferases, partial [uncultured Thermomicrobiales bacterium]